MIRSILIMVTALSCGFTQAETIEIKPKGEFALVDTTQDSEIIERLHEKSKSVIADVLSSPNDHSPPVLYALSYALFERNRKDEAMFWFYAGQLRARSDANKALDVSAKQAVAVLNQLYGLVINQYAFLDFPKLQRTVESVVKWDSENQRNYDPRWITLHGMEAFRKDTISFEPEDSWIEIDEVTRTEYLDDFYEVVGKVVN